MNWYIAVAALGLPLLAAAEPQLISVKKIWDAGPHNAFTDLIRFEGRWYCSFREADDHVGGDGKLRVLTSTDGESWSSSALVGEPGVDLRDPKLSITPDGRLMMVAGGSIYKGREFLGRRPRVTFSNDGRDWTPPRKILSDSHWLWRVTWHKGVAWGVSYIGQGGSPRSGFLYRSKDGVDWKQVTQLPIPGVAEVTVRIMPSDEMIALARRESDSKHGWIGVSQPPYVDWSWKEIGHRMGGPNFIRLPSGKLIAGSRQYGETPTTALANMTRTSYQPFLTLPSGGDTSYPGLVFHDGLLWVSYYSSHEGKTSIYLAKIRLGEED